MAHWFKSNFPWKALGVYLLTVFIACFRWGDIPLVLGTFFGIIAFTLYCCITFGIYDSIFNGIIKEILIPEFIDKRPFRQTEYVKKDEILQEILHNVNDKVYRRMGFHYGYTTTKTLLSAYELYISNFEKKYLEHYKDIPVEEIQGWDKIMLVAKNIQDEDLNFVFGNVISLDLINKYSTKKPVIVPEDNSNSNQLNKNSCKNNEYELSNMKDTAKVSEMV